MNLHQKAKPVYWQSLDELNNDLSALEAKHHEFKAGVTDEFDINEMSGISRRRFLAAMGASAAFALASCKNYVGKRKNGEIYTYNEHPVDVVIGRPNYYASTIRSRGGVRSALIKAREGRPVHITPNKAHPTDAFSLNSHYQAQIMGLYDPARLQTPQKSGSDTPWATADGEIIQALQAAASQNQQIAVMAPAVYSPTTAKALGDFKKQYPTTQIYAHALHAEATRIRAWEKSHGGNLPTIHWDKADVILALESDFLGVEAPVGAEYGFASRRDVMTDKTFNRLYVAEGNLTATGMKSDYRLRVRPDAQMEFVMALANALQTQGVSLPAGLAGKVSGFTLEAFAQQHGLSTMVLNHLVSDLARANGKSLIYAGQRASESLHILVNAINDALGANALYNAELAHVQQVPFATPQEVNGLIQDMASGKVAVLVHWNTNPVYELASLKYGDALAKVPVSVSFTTELNETAKASTYALPMHHDLESWGDAVSHAGVYTLQQPVIAPLHKSRQPEGVMLAWAQGDSAQYSEKLYYNYLKKAWQEGIYRQTNALVDFNGFWQSALHNGFVKVKAAGSVNPFKGNALSAIQADKSGSEYVLSLHYAYATLDGEFASSGWLQEIPHPVSKVVWDNYAAMSLGTAKALGVKTDDLVTVEVNGQSVTLPVLQQPGMAEKVIAVEIGYGRTVAGDIGSNVGVDVMPLLQLSSHDMWFAQANVAKASGSHHLVTTQNHHAFDVEIEQDLHYKRGIIHEANYLEYLQNPKVATMPTHPSVNITKVHEYEGIKWGMTIDANKCTGCNACVMACNIENNIPVVGPDQVDRGREMHWMRIDRYYSGTPEEPKVTQQVMLCQHCDNAPCEVVCPVNATNHSPDGLNQMAYNRCVGTRYCSNNCPYKVRRFNFFDYRDRFAAGRYHKELAQLVHNPEVTVRSRGVMEKCTFCVQRIMWARQEAIREKRNLKGTDVTVACQDVCPSQAISFGDSNDPNSDIAKQRKHATNYRVLQELNARPAVTYVATLRNTHEKV